jgi:regulatory protein
LRRRLLGAGFEGSDVDAALADLEEAGLVDDDRFAREVVADRAMHRMAGNRGIRAALRGTGVSPDVADRALEGAGDEAERARSLAAAKARRLSTLEPEAAYRRLFGLLVRRGFGPALASEASREALRVVFAPGSVPEADA